MTTGFKPLSVAIGDLTAHPANVRSNSPETYDPENIAHLKASIAVLGLLQPLLVQKLDGKYAVLAGGRRHAALKELVADKAAKGFTAKTKVDCRLVPEDCDVTTALSLAENITQAPMNAIDEFEAYARLLESRDNLWLDTTMALAGYFPDQVPWDLVRLRPERVMYGTDFPNIPFAWDRELRRLADAGLSAPALAQVLGGAATAFFRL